MKSGRKFLITATMLVLVLCYLVFMFYAAPILGDIYTRWNGYKRPVATIDDYSLHTTPMSRETIEDICQKLKITLSSEHCKSGMTVYSPEFFDDIKIFFYALPDKEATYQTVNDVLGPYLISCQKPNSNTGRFICSYDINGDGVYRIGFYFESDGHYYNIMDNRGGS